MATQGPNSAGAGATGGTGTAWTNPGNVTASDNVYATCLTTGSQQLRVTGFGFTIPAGATINGITVEIERKVGGTGGAPHDNVVQLVKDGSTLVGTNKASASTWPTVEAYATYGSAVDLWGATWSDSEVNASTFGVALSVVASIGSQTFSVDHVRITVDYTDADAYPAGHLPPRLTASAVVRM
jgi:hypothetical protein